MGDDNSLFFRSKTIKVLGILMFLLLVSLSFWFAADDQGGLHPGAGAAIFVLELLAFVMIARGINKHARLKQEALSCEGDATHEQQL